MINRFEDLIVWQKARILAKEIYLLAKIPEIKGDFGLRQQILNSSGSVADNIAEGFERDGKKEYRQFLSISKGSVGELRSQLYRISDRKIIKEEKYEELHNLATEISKMLSSMIANLNKQIYTGIKYKKPEL